MHKKLIGVHFAVATTALTALIGLATTASANHQPQHEESGAATIQAQELLQRRHVLGDDKIDTPLETDALHHGPGPTDGEEGEQHGGTGGHLPASSANVELVGQLTVSDATPGRIADVGTLKNFAYLGAFDDGTCRQAGVYVVDIADPTNPQEVGFIETAPGSYVGEGVQAIPLKTKSFQGDILVINNEICDASSGEQIGGFSIFDVTNPLNPVTLVEGFGDTEPPGVASTAHQIHSAFAWQQGKRAFVVIVDDEELLDVDIFEITDPRNPVFVAETGLEDWPDAQSPLANGDTTFFHDVVVEKVHGHWQMLLSYWDAGWVILNVDDPANPVFVGDTDYTDPDPEVGVSPPEGNGHQAEFTRNNRFIIGTDEDFSPERTTTFQFTTGANQGEYPAGIFGFGKSVSSLPDGTLNGPTVYGGYGCNNDVASIPPASVLAPEAGEERILVVSRGPVADPNHPFEACTFDEKAQNAIDAGYDAVIIGNHHVGADAGNAPDAALCGSGDVRDIFVLCMGHRALHLLFNTAENYDVPYPPLPNDEPLPNTLGDKVLAQAEFDGWGYVHLIDAETLEEIDTYAVPESLDVAFADDFGDLSVHEVAVDPKHDIAYLSYYAAGFRVIEYDKKTGIQEVGHFIAEDGNNFWGVQIRDEKKNPWGVPIPDFKGKGKYPLVLASDRDSGLWIFRYTGEEKQVAGNP